MDRKWIRIINIRLFKKKQHSATPPLPTTPKEVQTEPKQNKKRKPKPNPTTTASFIAQQ